MEWRIQSHRDGYYTLIVMELHPGNTSTVLNYLHCVNLVTDRVYTRYSIEVAVVMIVVYCSNNCSRKVGCM